MSGRPGYLTRGRLAARCDEDGVAAALATSERANVAYYEGLGFAVTTEISIPGGGPAHWAMSRKPRR